MSPGRAAELLELISDAALVVGTDGKIEAGNNGVERVFERGGDSVVGQFVSDVLVGAAESPSASAAESDPASEPSSDRVLDGDEFAWNEYLADPQPVPIAGRANPLRSA
ncbi:MAG: PAS domain-containing protein [Halorubrum sp.]